MLKLTAALLFGILTNTIRKLGPSVFIFIYLYFSQHLGERPVVIAGLSIPINALAIAIVTTLSILSVAFKSLVVSTGHRLDLACLPYLDQRVLSYIHGYDLRLRGIRWKSVAFLDIFHCLAIFAALAIVACVSSYAVGLILVLSVLVTLILALTLPNPGAYNSWPHFKAILEPENYSELVLITGLLLGFLFVLPKGNGLLSGTVILLLVTRFSGHLRTLARKARILYDVRIWVIQSRNAEQLRKAGKKA